MIDFRTKRAGVPHVRHNVIIEIGKARQSKGDTDDVNDIYDVCDKPQHSASTAQYLTTCMERRTLKDACIYNPKYLSLLKVHPSRCHFAPNALSSSLVQLAAKVITTTITVTRAHVYVANVSRR